MKGDGVALGRVEQAVGKVALGIDVYLILAVSGLAEVACVVCTESFVPTWTYRGGGAEMLGRGSASMLQETRCFNGARLRFTCIAYRVLIFCP